MPGMMIMLHSANTSAAAKFVMSWDLEQLSSAAGSLSIGEHSFGRGHLHMLLWLALAAGLRELAMFSAGNLTITGLVRLTSLTNLTRLCVLNLGDQYHEDVENYLPNFDSEGEEEEEEEEEELPLLHIHSKVRSASTSYGESDDKQALWALTA
jgi:hypothetical protein